MPRRVGGHYCARSPVYVGTEKRFATSTARLSGSSLSARGVLVAVSRVQGRVTAAQDLLNLLTDLQKRNQSQLAGFCAFYIAN